MACEPTQPATESSQVLVGKEPSVEFSSADSIRQNSGISHIPLPCQSREMAVRLPSSIADKVAAKPSINLLIATLRVIAIVLSPIAPS